MPDDISLHQGRWIVIPKGYDHTKCKLRVTLQWTPPENAPMERSDWPSKAPSTAFRFFTRASGSAHVTTAGAAYLPSAPLRPAPPVQVDREVWAAAFAAPAQVNAATSSECVSDTGTKSPSIAARWRTIALASNFHAMSAELLDAHQRIMGVRARGANVVPMRVALSGRSVLSDNAGIRAQDSPYHHRQIMATSGGGAMGAMACAMRDTYLPNEMSAAEMQRWMSRPTASLAQTDAENLFDQLCNAYADHSKRENKSAPDTPKGWQAHVDNLIRTGVAYEPLVRISRSLLQPPAISVMAPEEVTAQALVDDAVMGMAPWRDTGREPSDDPSRLSMVGQAFTLQTQLGMLIEMDLSINDLPQAHAAINAGQSFEIAAEPDFVQSAPMAWTRTDASGWPSDDPDPDDAVKAHAIPVSGGLLALEHALLTNVELRQSYQQYRSEVQSVASRLDYLLQAPDNAARDVEFLARIKTGPLSLHLAAMAERKAARYEQNQKAACSAGETVFTLQTLLIGIRPDVAIQPPGNKPFAERESDWRPMLSRRLRYFQCATPLPSPTGPEAEARTEGYLPLMRLSRVLDDSWVADDELFAWSGWNPAVPLPGQPAPGGPLSAHASPIPGSNPVFRYGANIKARVRLVLRDGTCLPHQTSDSTSTRACRLQRYEPLKAPAVLMAWTPKTSDWLPPETLHHVVLGTGGTSALVSRRQTVRYWLPGEIKDIFELDRHGAFDRGRTPHDSAFSGYQRTRDGFPVVDAPDVRVNPNVKDRPAGSQFPVFRRGPNDGLLPYHPDPLVEALVIAIARRTDDGRWWPVARGGHAVCCVHRLYPGSRRWPEALALRVEFNGVPADTGPALQYRRLLAQPDEALLRVSVPEGERFSLVAWPVGDPTRLTDAHAYGSLGGDGWRSLLSSASDHQDDLRFPMDGVSGLLSETSVIEVEHITPVPEAPALVHDDRLNLPLRQAGSLQQPYAIAVKARPGSVGGMDVVARWQDPLDDPALGEPREVTAPDAGYARSTDYAQASVVTLTHRWHAMIDKALSDVGISQLLRPAMWLPTQPTPLPAGKIVCWTTGTYALPDGKRRRVRYVPIAHGVLPDPESGPLIDPVTRQREGVGAVVDVMASIPPAVPVVRDVLPAFRFTRARDPRNASSTRHTAMTLLLERGWWSSGDGELLGLCVRTSKETPPASPVSSWGADAALYVDGGIDEPLQPKHFVSPRQVVASESEGVSLVLYKPEFDVENDAWRVDIRLATPPGVSLPFVQFALVRYQPHAIPGAHSSTVVMADFIQWQDDRAVSIVRESERPRRYRVVVRGPRMEVSAINAREMVMQLEGARRGPGPILWEPIGDPVRMTGSLDTKLGLTEWRANVSLQRKEIFERTRVRLMEYGQFERGVNAAEGRGKGPLFFLDRVEFGDIERDPPGNP